MREALFSSLGPRVVNARFLDLFAGSGAYGLEALSRGGMAGHWVERDRRTSVLLQANLAAVQKSLGTPASGDFRVWTADVLSWTHSGPFDLVFVDPPYAVLPRLAPQVFDLFETAVPLAADARVCFEHPGWFEVAPPGWELVRRLGKGGGDQPQVSILTRGA